MKILALMMMMGFFTGLKSAARNRDDSVMTCVGWAICFLASILQMGYVSGATGQMFWAITACIFISQMASILALTKPRKWLDIVTISAYVLGWLIMGIDLFTLYLGSALAEFTYPMTRNYTTKGYWFKKGRGTIVVVCIIFGMVIAWAFVHEKVTINIYTVIRWFIH